MFYGKLSLMFIINKYFKPTYNSYMVFKIDKGRLSAEIRRVVARCIAEAQIGKKSRRITEGYDLNNDRLEYLTDYAYGLFKSNPELRKMDDFIAYIKFDSTITSTVCIRKNPAKTKAMNNMDWIIYLNPEFVSKLIDKAVNGNEYEDKRVSKREVVEGSLRLFRIAIIWASYLGMVCSTQMDSDGYLLYRSNIKEVYNLTERELKKYFPKYRKDLMEFLDFRAVCNV